MSDEWSDLEPLANSDYVNHRCGSVPCPECRTPSPCIDHQSIDVGVGVVTGDHLYMCPRHGDFSESGCFRYPDQLFRCPECDARTVQEVCAGGDRSAAALEKALTSLTADVRDMKYIHENKRPLMQITLVVDSFEYERIKMLLPNLDTKKRPL